MKDFSINIIGLGNKTSQFEYTSGDEFFKKYEYGAVEGGNFKTTVRIDKHDTFIEAGFMIRGAARLICDRSLKPFDQAIEIDKRIVFKYGDEETELSDEIVVIRRDTATLELSQYVYEFIVLDLPMKRLHPDFRKGVEEDETAGKMVYTSASDENEGEDVIDPRWEQLKKLK